jgi:hypothetical protein
MSRKSIAQSTDPLMGRGSKAPHKALGENLGRDVLHARYNIDLSREGLDRRGFTKTRPEDVSNSIP